MTVNRQGDKGIHFDEQSNFTVAQYTVYQRAESGIKNEGPQLKINLPSESASEDQDQTELKEESKIREEGGDDYSEYTDVDNLNPEIDIKSA